MFMQIKRSDWLQLSREQRCSTFRMFNIHVINDSPTNGITNLHMAGQTCEERLDEIVDLLLPRDAHGNPFFFTPSSYSYLSDLLFFRQPNRDGPSRSHELGFDDSS